MKRLSFCISMLLVLTHFTVYASELSKLKIETEQLLRATNLVYDNNKYKLHIDINQCKLIIDGSPNYISTFFLDKIYNIEPYKTNNNYTLFTYCIENCYNNCAPRDKQCRQSNIPTVKLDSWGLNNSSLSNRKLVFDISSKLNRIISLCKK